MYKKDVCFSVICHYFVLVVDILLNTKNNSSEILLIRANQDKNIVPILTKGCFLWWRFRSSDAITSENESAHAVWRVLLVTNMTFIGKVYPFFDIVFSPKPNKMTFQHSSLCYNDLQRSIMALQSHFECSK